MGSKGYVWDLTLVSLILQSHKNGFRILNLLIHLCVEEEDHFQTFIRLETFSYLLSHSFKAHAANTPFAIAGGCNQAGGHEGPASAAAVREQSLQDPSRRCWDSTYKVGGKGLYFPLPHVFFILVILTYSFVFLNLFLVFMVVYFLSVLRVRGLFCLCELLVCLNTTCQIFAWFVIHGLGTLLVIVGEQVQFLC